MICEGCGEFEAIFILKRGKLIFNKFHVLETYHVCEMCLLEDECYFDSIDIPYRVKAIPEKVKFT